MPDFLFQSNLPASLRIGHRVLATVVKALPDKDAYLVYVSGLDLLAVLPKCNQDRGYRVGDTLMAAVMALNGPYPILTQRSVQYWRQVADVVLAPLIQARVVAVRKVASAVGAPFIKIAVQGLGTENPVGACLKYEPAFASYLTPRVVFVRWSADLKRYIAAALAPAPASDIKRIAVWWRSRTAMVEIEASRIAAFLGPHGLNVAVANKLVDYHIELVAIRQEEGTQMGEPARQAGVSLNPHS